MFTRKLALLAILFTFSIAANASIDSNKKLVVDFYHEVIFNKNADAIDKYIGKKYIQHNPYAADGKEGLRQFVTKMAKMSSSTKPPSEIIRVIADNDLVVLHIKTYASSGKPSKAIMDIFRVENGMIVEHWDVVQKIPQHANNNNTMF